MSTDEKADRLSALAMKAAIEIAEQAEGRDALTVLEMVIAAVIVAVVSPESHSAAIVAVLRNAPDHIQRIADYVEAAQGPEAASDRSATH